jgi:septal ring factor EnvC (AmiA/AmiB activator)
VGEILIVGPSGSERPKNTGTALTVSAEPFSNRPVNVSDVPWWPVAGTKRPLEGKLTGVAIETDSLSYVHAVAGGQVVWTGPYRGFGHVVLVDSNGYIYLYGGNEDLFVNVGQSITAGSRIGRLGSSGPDGGKKDMIFSVFREGVPVSPDEAPRG